VAAPQTTSGFAIASLVLSIAGFAGLALVGPILGVIFGNIALNEIKRSNGTIGGEGLAQAGVIIGWIGIGLAILGVLIAVVVLVLFSIFAANYQPT
jgi:hypothetical protein